MHHGLCKQIPPQAVLQARDTWAFLSTQSRAEPQRLMPYAYQGAQRGQIGHGVAMAADGTWTVDTDSDSFSSMGGELGCDGFLVCCHGLAMRSRLTTAAAFVAVRVILR